MEDALGLDLHINKSTQLKSTQFEKLYKMRVVGFSFH